MQSMIKEYKEHISKTHLEDERYKWELVNEYRGRPNLKAEDLYQEIKDTNFSNLIYAMAKAVIIQLAKERPEETRQIFIDLYDESVDLTERVKIFDKQTKKLYKELGETNPHHQDERSIATYLTFHNSVKYTFYKYSFYKKYCDRLGVELAKKNYRYTHYLQLIDDLIENYILPDSELIEQVKTYIPEYYEGTDNKILAQDILYQMLEKETGSNYWIFQGDPKVFDYETALRDEVLTDWTVTAHKDKIKIGDKVILWMTGNQAGCYALAEITSEPYKKDSSPDDHLWKGDPKSDLKVDIKITHNLVDAPILKEKIDTVEELKDLKVGNQGTNFASNQEEFEAILKMTTTVNDFYDILKQVKPKAENVGFVFNSFNERSRYVWIHDQHSVIGNKTAHYEIIARRNKVYVELHFEDSNTHNFFHSQIPNLPENLEWFKWSKEGQSIRYSEYNLQEKDLTNKLVNDLIDFDKLIGNKIRALLNKLNEEQMTYPLNTIFYGPPGTGKTYHTILRAAQIIENRSIESYDEALRIFNANLHDRIEFITFHQNYSYEDFIQGLRPDTENDNLLTFERKDGVFKIIADKALKNLNQSEKPQVIKRPFEEVFNQFINPLVEGEVEEIEVKMKKVSYFITAVSNKSIDFRKASGGSAHTLSIGTLKKMYLAESVLEIQGLASYYNPLLDEILKLGKDSSGKKERIKRENYVIIIDEINRANISRVFGELITLIEPDKRSGGAIPLEARLPSGDPFMVPSNLYIIGTMNTADKSIALLDIALRRRFEFESMYPNYDITDVEIYDVDILKKINKQIIKSKGHDFQIGHAYFMGKNDDLVTRMNNKVIPLLMEYYMNDEDEVKGILQAAGLQLKEGSWPLKISSKND